jgi:aryl-alcohol dehydrogenase-like predicted oxidoreductase
VTSVILGASDRSQLETNLAATTLELGPEELASLESASAQRLPFPYWRQTSSEERFA